MLYFLGTIKKKAMSTLLVHDTRLIGSTPRHLADSSLVVGGGTLIGSLINNIMSVADRQGTALDTVMIMCHGFQGSGESQQHQASYGALGFGLHLCREGLTLRNVDRTYPLWGYMNNIVLYACGPANTHPFATGTIGDGSRFCSYLAAYTNANVYASSETQYYTNGNYDNIDRVCEDVPIDFGGWEGHVYQFTPDGSVYQVQ